MEPTRLSQAKEFVTKMLTRFTDDETVSRMAGWIYINLNDPAAAKKSFERAQSLIKPEEKLSIDLLAGLSLSRWLVDDRDIAIETYRQLIEAGRALEEPQDWSLATTILGRSWADNEKLPLEALRAATVDKFPDLAPNDAWAYFNRGLVKDELKDYDGAMKDYDEAIRLNPEFATAFSNRGLVKDKLKDYEGALKDYDDAIRLDPKMTNPKNNKAFLLSTCQDEKIRDSKNAMQLANDCLDIDSKNAYAMNAKACAYALAGDFVSAIEWERKAMEDADYMSDKEIDGGVIAIERIQKWESKSLWLAP